jgi:hypothetical protein
MAHWIPLKKPLVREALNVSVSITDFITDCAKPLHYAATGSFGLYQHFCFSSYWWCGCFGRPLMSCCKNTTGLYYSITQFISVEFRFECPYEMNSFQGKVIQSFQTQRHLFVVPVWTLKNVYFLSKMYYLVHSTFTPNKGKSKSKGLLQQAEVAQGVPGRLRSRIFLTFGTTSVVDRQSYAPAAFTPWEIPVTYF